MYNLKTLICFSFIFINKIIGQTGGIQPVICTPIEAVDYLVGKGVAINSIKFTGLDRQLGKFTFPSYTTDNFGFGEGIMLSTGSVLNSSGPKRVASNGLRGRLDKSEDLPIGGDNDCQRIAAKSNSKGAHDGASLEIEFSTLGDKIEFEFIFASQEYPEFVTQGFNDIFCLLMKGPGIAMDTEPGGGKFFSDEYKNYALINGVEIAVNTVNSTTNSSFFIDGVPSDLTAFDGYTTTIKVEIPVQCGQTYKFKIAISDINDGSFDSYVLLKKGSLTSAIDVGNIEIPSGPFCSGQPYTLKMNGSNNLNYLWSTGETTKEIAIYPSQTGQEYWLDITDPITGCTIRKKAVIGKVFESNNTKPYTKGIDNTYEYEYTIQAGKNFCFDVTGYDYQNNELVKMDWSENISGATFEGDRQPVKNPKRTFCWTPTNNDIGYDSFYVYLKDNNPCSSGFDTIKYKITIICPQCGTDLRIENKDLVYVKINKQNISAVRIIAGKAVDPDQLDGDVLIGPTNGNVLFKAGKEINFEEGLLIGDDAYVDAFLEPVCTKKEYCDTCCSNVTDNDFRLTFSNVFTPNGDGINDVWQVVDYNNPNCAYNITGFEFLVYNSWGVLIYKQVDNGPQTGDFTCCRFHSPANGEEAQDLNKIASIYWKGGMNQPWTGSGSASTGTYYCVLSVYGCNGAKMENIEFTILINSSNTGQPPPNNDDTTTNSDTIENNQSNPSAIVFKNTLNCYTYPNPTDNNLNVFIDNWKPEFENNSQITLTDAQGKMVFNQILKSNLTTLNLNSLSSNTYNAKITIGEHVFYKSIIINK